MEGGGIRRKASMSVSSNLYVHAVMYNLWVHLSFYNPGAI